LGNFVPRAARNANWGFCSEPITTLKEGTMVNFEEITDSMITLDVSKAADLTRAAIENGVPAIEILNQGLLPGMKIIGDRFRSGEFFLPEVILGGRAMKAAMAHLKPAFKSEGVTIRGRVAIGTVKDDIHDIGKNLVIMMLEGNGWDVIDLGVDVDAEQFCSFVMKNDLDILGLSALLTTTIPRLKEAIDALETAGLREKVKVIVGGALVTQVYADEIGADGFAPNAVEAVALAEQLVK
jgi:5-methyltetrahydrofolate--homocysteine methyltransferase